MLPAQAKHWYEVGVPTRPALFRAPLLTWAVTALLFGGTLLLYTRAVGYGFLNYDDPRYVTANPHVQAPFAWASVAWAFTARTELWQPLTWFSHMLDWSVYGENAAGHHLTSVLWHALNAVLAFFVFRRITGTFWTSALAAALFAWHPLRVESVAWVTERKDVMSGSFFLLTLLAYLRFAEQRSRGEPARGRYLLTLAVFTSGLMCKPTLVTVPFLLLAFDFWPLRRTALPGVTVTAHSRWWGLVIEKVPFFLLSLVVGLVTTWLQRDYGAFTLALPLGARLANVPAAMMRYLGKFFWPANLSVCYPHPGWWPASVFVAAILVVVAITIAAWRWRQTQPWILTGWIWFVALLLPTVGIVQVGFQSMADRYTYLPMLGWELALIWSVRAVCRTAISRAVAFALGAALLVGAGMRTWQQEAIWRDSLTLFRHAIAASGSSSISESFLGYTLVSVGKLDEAAQHATRALALDPNNEMAVFTLAHVYANQGRVAEAIAEYRRSLELKPNEPGTKFELGLLLLQQGNIAEARTQFAEAVRLNPSLRLVNDESAAAAEAGGQTQLAALRYIAGTLLDPTNPRAHFAAGVALLRLGDDRRALASLSRAVELKPNFVAARVELGLLLLKLRDASAARPHFRAALAVSPHLAAANVGLGRAEEALGRTSEADECFERALRDAPDDADVSRTWADVLARRGRFTDAVTFYRRSISQRPTDAMAHAGLGYALFITAHRDEAITAWKEALRLDPKFPGLRERLQRLGVSDGLR